MKKLKFLLVAAAASFSLAFFSSAKASANKFPQCKSAPEDVCATGPGGTTLLYDFRNR